MDPLRDRTNISGNNSPPSDPSDHIRNRRMDNGTDLARDLASSPMTDYNEPLALTPEIENRGRGSRSRSDRREQLVPSSPSLRNMNNGQPSGVNGDPRYNQDNIPTMHTIIYPGKAQVTGNSSIAPAPLATQNRNVSQDVREQYYTAAQARVQAQEEDSRTQHTLGAPLGVQQNASARYQSYNTTTRPANENSYVRKMASASTNRARQSMDQAARRASIVPGDLPRPPRTASGSRNDGDPPSPSGSSSSGRSSRSYSSRTSAGRSRHHHVPRKRPSQYPNLTTITKFGPKCSKQQLDDWYRQVKEKFKVWETYHRFELDDEQKLAIVQADALDNEVKSALECEEALTNNPPKTLDELYQRACARYLPPNSEKTDRTTFSKTRQGDKSVADYTRVFDEAAYKLADLTYTEARARYIEGLRKEFQIEIHKHFAQVKWDDYDLDAIRLHLLAVEPTLQSSSVSRVNNVSLEDVTPDSLEWVEDINCYVLNVNAMDLSKVKCFWCGEFGHLKRTCGVFLSGKGPLVPPSFQDTPTRPLQGQTTSSPPPRFTQNSQPRVGGQGQGQGKSFVNQRKQNQVRFNVNEVSTIPTPMGKEVILEPDEEGSIEEGTNE